MLTQELRREETEVRRAIALQQEKGEQGGSATTFAPSAVQTVDYSTTERKRRRWDDDTQTKGDETPVVSKSEWDRVDATPIMRAGSAGDETPGGGGGVGLSSSSVKAVSSRWDVTPAVSDGNATGPRAARSRWDETPISEEASKLAGKWDAPVGPTASTVEVKKRSRWDETPMAPSGTDTNMIAATPSATPMGHMGNMNTPMGASYSLQGSSLPVPMTPELTQQLRWEAEVDERNRYMPDEELDALFPSTGYKILDQPASYIPISTPQRKLLAAPTPQGQTPGFTMAQTPSRESYAIPPSVFCPVFAAC